MSYLYAVELLLLRYCNVILWVYFKSRRTLYLELCLQWHSGILTLTYHPVETHTSPCLQLCANRHTFLERIIFVFEQFMKQDPVYQSTSGGTLSALTDTSLISSCHTLDLSQSPSHILSLLAPFSTRSQTLIFCPLLGSRGACVCACVCVSW